MKTKRAYVMRARAAAAEETRRRILGATMELSHEKMTLDIVLVDIAQRAGVSVQTILRHFGTRDGLFDATETFAREQVTEERATPPGDVPAAVRVLLDHYELRGDAVLRLLGQEFFDARAQRITDQGRRVHRSWVEDVFAPQLAAYPETDRAALTDLLVVATDVYTWKLLRRDRGLDRAQTERRVFHLIDVLLTSTMERN
jgi:AcrR family transcriptional regulator